MAVLSAPIATVDAVATLVLAAIAVLSPAVAVAALA